MHSCVVASLVRNISTEPCRAEAPYVLTKEFMDVLFTQHRIDYIVHGDDPCLLPDGSDVYDYPKKIGRFRVARTPGWHPHLASPAAWPCTMTIACLRGSHSASSRRASLGKGECTHHSMHAGEANGGCQHNGHRGAHAAEWQVQSADKDCHRGPGAVPPPLAR
jgi:hypothetical protein